MSMFDLFDQAGPAPQVIDGARAVVAAEDSSSPIQVTVAAGEWQIVGWEGDDLLDVDVSSMPDMSEEDFYLSSVLDESDYAYEGH